MIRDVVLTRINLLLLALLAAVTAYAFVAVPADAILPVHWRPDGRADRFAGRTEAFLMMPVIVLAMCGLFAAIVRYMPREQVEGGKHGLGVIISALLVLFLTIQSGLLLTGLGMPVAMVQLIMLGMALLLIVTGNVLPKSQPNRFAGIRLPWTLADQANWRATHRLVGMLMMAGGFLLAILALLPIHPLVLFAGFLLAVLIPLIVGGIYSYQLSRRA